MPSQGGKPRTSVLTKPSNPKALRTRAPLATSMTIAGTWNTHTSPRKKHLNESGVLKEVTPHAMMDSSLIGTSLSSDLNTPEIRIDSFAFNGKTVKCHETDVATNSFPEGMKQSDPVDGGFSMECLLPQETESLFDPYIFLDMSPGSDVLQPEQLEERINVQEYAGAHEREIIVVDDNSVGPALASQRTTLPQSLTLTDTASVNSISSQSVHMDHSMQQIPELSIPEDDNLHIPQELLVEMETMFPDFPSDLNPNSTDLDMYLGTHDDLLYGVMQQSGMVNFELNGFDPERSGIDASMLVADQPVVDQLFADGSCITQPDSMTIDAVLNEQPEVIDPVYTDCLVKDPLTFVNIDYQPAFETPTPSTSYALHPQRPSKKRLSFDSETPNKSVKRLRRTSRKPLRFRDADVEDSLLQDEDNESADNHMETTLILKEEPEVYETATVSGTANVSSLTEQQKYHRIRILNNEASKRCRQKRKQNLSQLEVDLQDLQERNEQLKKKHDALQRLRDQMKPLLYKFISQGLASSRGFKKENQF